MVNECNGALQTMAFEFQIFFNNSERVHQGLDLEGPILHADSAEDITQAFHKERKRRSRVDRATGYRWRAVLTPYGVHQLGGDIEAAKRHQDVNWEWTYVNC